MPIHFSERGNVYYDIEGRWIALRGAINKHTAADFAKFLVSTQMVGTDWRMPVLVLLNSPGGDSIAGLLIYYMLANLPSPVTTIVENEAYSAAFIVSQAGGLRKIIGHGKMRFHWAIYRLLEDESWNADGIDLVREKLARINGIMYRIVAERSKLSMRLVKQFFRESRSLTARQALKYNLADEIVPLSKLRKLRLLNKRLKKRLPTNKRRHGPKTASKPLKK